MKTIDLTTKMKTTDLTIETTIKTITTKIIKTITTKKIETITITIAKTTTTIIITILNSDKMETVIHMMTVFIALLITLLIVKIQTIYKQKYFFSRAICVDTVKHWFYNIDN